MVGVGIIFRISRKFLGKYLENSGLLPTRYYLHEVLEALDDDKLGHAVRFLRMSRDAWADKRRWDFVRQQVVFRCRVLQGRHTRKILYLENQIQKSKKRPIVLLRWLYKPTRENTSGSEGVLILEREARAILERYEAELKML